MNLSWHASIIRSDMLTCMKLQSTIILVHLEEMSNNNFLNSRSTTVIVSRLVSSVTQYITVTTCSNNHLITFAAAVNKHFDVTTVNDVDEI